MDKRYFCQSIDFKKVTLNKRFCPVRAPHCRMLGGKSTGRQIIHGLRSKKSKKNMTEVKYLTIVLIK